MTSDKTRSGVLLYTEDSDGVRIFMVKQSESGNWGLSKGSVNAGESLAAAAARELEEEAGFCLSVDDLLKPSVVRICLPEYSHTYFVVKIPSREDATLRNMAASGQETDEILAFRWATHNDIFERVASCRGTHCDTCVRGSHPHNCYTMQMARFTSLALTEFFNQINKTDESNKIKD